jgi:hypothetical protein
VLGLCQAVQWEAGEPLLDRASGAASDQPVQLCRGGRLTAGGYVHDKPVIIHGTVTARCDGGERDTVLRRRSRWHWLLRLGFVSARRQPRS